MKWKDEGRKLEAMKRRYGQAVVYRCWMECEGTGWVRSVWESALECVCLCVRRCVSSRRRRESIRYAFARLLANTILRGSRDSPPVPLLTRTPTILSNDAVGAVHAAVRTEVLALLAEVLCSR